MSDPVIPSILEVQSVLEFLQWQSFEFQPFATGSPTGWNCSPLPTGVTFDPAIGRISGAASRPGVFVIGLVAFNDDGVSLTQTFTIGVEASLSIPPVDATEILIDIGTKEATAVIPPKRTILLNSGDTTGVLPVCWAKLGDVALYHIRFAKNGVVAPLDLSGLFFTLKATEPDTRLLVASAFVRGDTGDNTFYRLAVIVTGGALSGELSDDETDAKTEFAALGEFVWTQANSLVPTVGPDNLRSSTLNFRVGVGREMAPAS